MRTSLLLNCSKNEAEQVRQSAERQQRTVSTYVVRVVMKSVSYVENLDQHFAHLPNYWKRRAKKKLLGPRTTLHIYCTGEEAKRIRTATEKRAMTISGFVFRCLHLA
jgi:hypothetical protein